MTTLEILMYGAIFAFGFFALELILRLVASTQAGMERAANRRARLLAQGQQSDSVLAVLSRNRTVVKGHDVVDQWRNIPLVKDFQTRLAQAGITTPLTQILGIAGAVAIALFMALVFVTKTPVVLALVVAPAFAFGMLWVIVGVMKTRRFSQFGEQLPDTIDMIVRSLQAGHPIRSALSLVAEDMPDPIGTEFGLVVDEMTYGRELDEALNNLRDRVDLQDLHYMVVAINIQSRTGGNLAEILQNLSSVIRDRFRLGKKARALSAEGRMSAYVLAAVPFVITLILHLSVPYYYPEAARNPSFPYVVMAALFIYTVAIYAIFRIVNIKV